jgi:putative toxin-antitoxin system antitoxin component (TIGR02293 family)
MPTLPSPSKLTAPNHRKAQVPVGAAAGPRRKVAAQIKSGGLKGTEPALSFVQLFNAEPLERIAFIKQGVPATWPELMARRMSIDKGTLLKTLGLPRATIDRKASANRPLSADEGARVVGMARLVGQVQAMVDESGQPQGFDAGKWLAQWLERELPAFGGRRPADLMDTAEGQAMVSQWLARIASGAYA